MLSVKLMFGSNDVTWLDDMIWGRRCAEARCLGQCRRPLELRAAEAGQVSQRHLWRRTADRDATIAPSAGKRLYLTTDAGVAAHEIALNSTCTDAAQVSFSDGGGAELRALSTAQSRPHPAVSDLRTEPPSPSPVRPQDRAALTQPRQTSGQSCSHPAPSDLRTEPPSHSPVRPQDRAAFTQPRQASGQSRPHPAVSDLGTEPSISAQHMTLEPCTHGRRERGTEGRDPAVWES